MCHLVTHVGIRHLHTGVVTLAVVFYFFQAEDGIRYLVRSRGLGDVYKRQAQGGTNVQARHAKASCSAGDIATWLERMRRRLLLLALIHI